MKTRISHTVESEALRLIPGIRRQVEAQCNGLGIKPSQHFYSDKQVISQFTKQAPFYLQLEGFSPTDVKKFYNLAALNKRSSTIIKKVTTQSLRKLANS